MSRTRAELLRGAVRAFAEHGVRRAAMQDIAAAAGVAKATLYNHFRTKDDVARAVLAAELDRVAAVAQGRPAAEALLVLAEEAARHPVLRRLAQSEPELLVRLLTAPAGDWAAVVAAVAAVSGLDPADAEPVTRWLLGLVLQPGTAAMRLRGARRLAEAFAAGHPDALSDAHSDAHPDAHSGHPPDGRNGSVFPG
jgi:AcrR family transcriptional regulator